MLLLPNFQRSSIILSFLYRYPILTYLLSTLLFSLSLSSLSFFTSRLFESGCKGKSYFIFTKSFFTFSLSFFLLFKSNLQWFSSFYLLSLFLCHCLFDGGAKVRVSFILQNLSHFFSFFFSTLRSEFQLLLQTSILRASFFRLVCLFYEQVSI